MIYQVKPAVEMTLMELDEVNSFDTVDDDLTTHLWRFYLKDDEVDSTKLNVKMKAPGDGRKKKEENRKSTMLDMSYLTHLNNASITQAFAVKKRVAIILEECLRKRFEDNFKDEVLNAMKWFDHTNWTNEKDYAHQDFEKLYKHFTFSLDSVGYDPLFVKREWASVRRFISANIAKELPATHVWEKVLVSRRMEFPNVCLLVELIIVISGSNSTVERSFSLLSNMLTDKRLSTTHATMNMLLKIKINDSLWNERERQEIIDRAMEIFMTKRRRVQLSPFVSEGETSCQKRQYSVEEKNAYGKRTCEWIDGEEDEEDETLEEEVNMDVVHVDESEVEYIE